MSEFILYLQGYLVVGLEERLKYLRRPHKRSQTDSGAPPPAKRPPKPLMPQVALTARHAVGEDDASHTRNVKMLQALSKQVCIQMQLRTCLLYMCVYMCTYDVLHEHMYTVFSMYLVYGK